MEENEILEETVPDAENGHTENECEGVAAAAEREAPVSVSSPAEDIGGSRGATTDDASYGDGAIDRLADEFIALKTEFPEVTDVDSLPDEVFVISEEKGCSLADAYARFKLSEQTGIALARNTSRDAAAASAGSLADTVPDNAERFPALMRGIWGKR